MNGATSMARSAVFAPLGDTGRRDALVARLVDGILLGILAPGERLPAEPVLAARFGVATTTVRDALCELREQRLIETRRGRGGGSFVTLSDADRRASLEHRIRSRSRAELADLGTYCDAIVGSGAALAAEQATPRELEGLARELAAADFSTEFEARRALGGFHLHVVAFSQSVRLVREQVRVQHDFGPLLFMCLIDERERDAARASCEAVVAALFDGEADAARAAIEALTRRAVRWLIAEKNQLEAS